MSAGRKCFHICLVTVVFPVACADIRVGHPAPHGEGKQPDVAHGKRVLRNQYNADKAKTRSSHNDTLSADDLYTLATLAQAAYQMYETQNGGNSNFQTAVTVGPDVGGASFYDGRGNSDFAANLQERLAQSLEPAGALIGNVTSFFNSPTSPASRLAYNASLPSPFQFYNTTVKLRSRTNMEYAVFSFRGTQSSAERMLDSTAQYSKFVSWPWPAEFGVSQAGSDSHVSLPGQVNAANAIAFVTEFNASVREFVRSHVSQNTQQSRPLLFVGHSLGGIFAAFGAYVAVGELMHLGVVLPDVSLYTYNSPKQGDTDFTRFLDRNLAMNVRHANYPEAISQSPTTPTYNIVEGYTHTGTYYKQCIQLVPKSTDIRQPMLTTGAFYSPTRGFVENLNLTQLISNCSGPTNSVESAANLLLNVAHRFFVFGSSCGYVPSSSVPDRRGIPYLNSGVRPLSEANALNCPSCDPNSLEQFPDAVCPESSAGTEVQI